MSNKEIKSLTELVNEGWDRNLLYRISHMPHSPAFRSNPRGKFYFRMDALRNFIDTKGIK